MQDTGTSTDWAVRLLGDAGPEVRRRIPSILQESHNALALAQAQSEMEGHQVYGNVYLKVHQMLTADLVSLPGARVVRVPSAAYSLIAFGNTVIFPWRYSREVRVAATEAPMGRVSETRRQIFDGFAQDPQMAIPFPMDSSADDVAENDDAEKRAIEEALESGHRVLVIAYASNVSALLRAEWGEAELVGEGLALRWKTSEPLPLVAAEASLTLVASGVAQGAAAFANAPLAEPAMSLRQSGRNGGSGDELPEQIVESTSPAREAGP